MASTAAVAPPTTSSPSPGVALPHWLTRWSFGSTTKLPDNITVSEIHAVDDPVHANQRVEKSFTVFAPPQTPSPSDALATTAAEQAGQYNAVVRSPGLTVVRVRPQLVDEAGPDVVARVRVSSDAEEHLDRLRVELSDELALTLDYNAATRGTTGHILTEIDVPRASQFHQVVAMCGGDVVVHEDALSATSASATGDPGNRSLAPRGNIVLPSGTTLMALYGSRLFLSAPQKRLCFDNLTLAALGSSSVHVEAQQLVAGKVFLAGVLGNGRIDVRATHFGTTMGTFAVAGTGNVQLTATKAFHAGGIDAFLRGDSLIRVTTPPDALVDACITQDISVGRTGIVDLADVPSAETKIRLTRPATGIARIRAPTEKLAIECPGSASDGAARVQHVGELPTDVRHKNASGQLTQLSDTELASVRAEWDDSADAWRDAVAVPTIESAFETPVALDGPPEGWLSPIVGPLVRCMLPF